MVWTEVLLNQFPLQLITMFYQAIYRKVCTYEAEAAFNKWPLKTLIVDDLKSRLRVKKDFLIFSFVQCTCWFDAGVIWPRQLLFLVCSHASPPSQRLILCRFVISQLLPTLIMVKQH